MEDKMIFAVDYDGTLSDHSWPGVGTIKLDTLNFCKERQQLGDKIILWTCRTGRYLKEALEYLESFDFKPDYVNENVPWDTSIYPDESRKVGADYYIDDRSIHVQDLDKLRAKLLNK